MPRFRQKIQDPNTEGFIPSINEPPPPAPVAPAPLPGEESGSVGINLPQPPVPYVPPVVPGVEQPIPGPEQGVTGGEQHIEPALPGPVPQVEMQNEEVLPLALPPNTPTGLPTFGVGGGVPKTLRTANFNTNRSVGGVSPLLEGITGRFGPGIPTVGSTIPSGATGDDTGQGVSDEELLKSIRLGKGRGR